MAGRCWHATALVGLGLFSLGGTAAVPGCRPPGPTLWTSRLDAALPTAHSAAKKKAGGHRSQTKNRQEPTRAQEKGFWRTNGERATLTLCRRPVLPISYQQKSRKHDLIIHIGRKLQERAVNQRQTTRHGKKNTKAANDRESRLFVLVGRLCDQRRRRRPTTATLKKEVM